MTALIISSVLAAGLALVAGPAAAAGDVTVQVDDVDGNGIEGADVTVYDAADDSEVANGSTDSTGSFTASGVSDGDYYAAVDDPGYVNVDETETVTITASNAQIDVELVEANELVNNSVAVTNSSESAYADVSANSSLLTANNSTRAAVEIVGINQTDDGNESETVLKSTTEEVSEGSTASIEYVLTDDDRETFDEVRVVVEGQDNHTDAVEGGTLESATGGGGSSGGLDGLLSVTIMGIPLVAILVLVGIVALVYRSEG